MPISWLDHKPHAIAVYASWPALPSAHATLATGRPATALPGPVLHRLDCTSFCWRLRKSRLVNVPPRVCLARRPCQKAGKSAFFAHTGFVEAKMTFLQLGLFVTSLAVVVTPLTAHAYSCSEYARSAVADYELMKEHFRECRVPDDARWQPNYQNHLNWCKTAQAGWVRSERQARDKHLLHCRARATY